MSPSSAPGHLDWVVMQEGKKVEYRPEEEVEETDEGNWKTTSELEFVAGGGDEVVVECLASHEASTDDTVAHVHVIKIGHNKSSEKDGTIEISNNRENEPTEVQTEKEYSDEVNLSLKEKLTLIESTSSSNEDDELFSDATKEGTNGIKESIMDTGNEEASAIKDAKLINTASKTILSLFCKLLCYLSLLII